MAKKPLANLHAIFDLAGSFDENAATYTKHLSEKFTKYVANQVHCPLFKSMAFILPDNSEWPSIKDSFLQIIKILNDQKYKPNNQLTEIAFYNVDIKNVQACREFLDFLEKLAQQSSNPLKFMIYIPSWDRDSYTDPEQCKIKARYKALQNKMLDYQRQEKLPVLSEVMQYVSPINEAKKEQKSVITLSDVQKPKSQPWPEQDVFYPLHSQHLGIQQQLQQGTDVQTNLAQDQDMQQMHDMGQNTALTSYQGSEVELITRDNINHNAFCQNLWATVPDAQKKLFSNNATYDLSLLFSMWVGSSYDAAYTINKIEPAAVKKIMENLREFLLGISSSRIKLPPGFMLTNSQNGGYILCFNEKQEHIDLLAFRREKNPLMVVLHEPMPAEVFHGDYRQFATLSPQNDYQKVLWKYLATEDNNPVRLENAKKALADLKRSTKKEEDVSIQMQEFTATLTTTNAPGDIATCLQTLHKLTQNQKINPAISDAFFKTDSKTRFTHRNLLAWGQFLYRYEVLKPETVKNGSHHFFTLAEFIYKEFGKENFAIWKTRFIDPSANLSECIAEEEVTAIVHSSYELKKLRDPIYSKLWWQLVDAHGNATGHMRYASLWASYQTVIKYIHANKSLVINLDQIEQYLKKQNTYFHGQVFLERLYTVLQDAEKTLEKTSAQQKILDNIANIDWSHSGFYYASHIEKYPYWDESLKLTGFLQAQSKTHPSYIPAVNANETIPTSIIKTTVAPRSQQRITSSKLDVTDEKYDQSTKITRLPADIQIDIYSRDLSILSQLQEMLAQNDNGSNATLKEVQVYLKSTVLSLKNNKQDSELIAKEITHYCETKYNENPEHRDTVAQFLQNFFNKWQQLTAPKTTQADITKSSVQETRSQPLEFIKLQHLRFVCHKMKVSPDSYSKFEQLITFCFDQNIAQKASLSHLLLAMYSQGVNRAGDLDTVVTKNLIVDVVSRFSADESLLLTWLSEKIDLNNQVPGYLHLRFEHILNVVSAIKRAKITEKVTSLSTEQAIAFINACGRALQCFAQMKLASEKSPEDILVGLLTSKLPQEVTHPIFTTAPWLFPVLDTPEATSSSFLKTIDSTDIQLETLKKQLQSINFNASSSLPTLEDLNDVVQGIAKNSNLATVRKEFVTRQIAKGCAITYENTEFRKLSKDELNIANKLLKKHLKYFHVQNSARCEYLLTNYIAVRSQGSEQEDKITKLVALFARIENKPYYNELAPLIGLLCEAAEKDHRYYSIEQLIKWLETLVESQTTFKHHFPVKVLKEILTSHQDKHSNLLNTNIESLGTDIDSLTLGKVKGILSTKVADRYKPILVKISLQITDILDFINSAKTALEALQSQQERYPAIANSRWMEGINTILELIANNQLLQHRKEKILEHVASTYRDAKLEESILLSDEGRELASLWQKTQIKLIGFIKFYQNNARNLDMVCDLLAKRPSSIKDTYIKIIILQSLQYKDASNLQEELLTQFKQRLEKLDEPSLKTLALYCRAKPAPSVQDLNSLLATQLATQNPSIPTLIDEYQKLKAPKRDYSVTEKDREGLTRVLSGLKLKGNNSLDNKEKQWILGLLYYINTYSQAANLAALSFTDLKKKLHNERIASTSSRNPVEKTFASARLLACMREILLRTRKQWVNHTQMLDLLFSILHNDQSLLHQVKTGQGKSIISFMRAAYLALNGNVVDVFSAKESLSKRDIEKFSPVFEAMGIACSYITPESPSDSYHGNIAENGIGAVHYATIGNMSLFQSAQVWQHSKNIGIPNSKKYQNINLNPEKRVALIDEADQILNDPTQFNYSDNRDADGIYNFDEWVYYSTYEFYLQNKDNFKGKISLINHLRPLCEKLQKDALHSPPQSTFMARFILPAADGSEEAISTRNTELLRLLMAAHTASELKLDSEFTRCKEQLRLDEGTTADIRMAKVVNDNQIKEGSSYSDLVQQMLHVRCNLDAKEGNETPDFFTEPESQIALSSNVRDFLNKYYYKREGFTGTAGNAQNLEFYKEVFDIKHVVKLPTHELSRTDFLATQYCNNEDEHLQKIIATLHTYDNQPILITCKDDKEVKALSQKIIKLLGNDPRATDIIVDTNDSLKPEKDIVRLAGKTKAITLSARMGRGTDIEPESEEGLLVLRTYFTKPITTKQELGRQGRNGAKGKCIDIINYEIVEKECKHYTQDEFWNKRLTEITEEQHKHLEEKLQKHKANLKSKWQWLQDQPHTKAQYITARSLAFLKQEIADESKKYLRQKEDLLAKLSGNIMAVLKKHYAPSSFPHTELQEDWLRCRKRIEMLWNIRLDNHEKDTQETFAKFLTAVGVHWGRLCQRYKDLDPRIFDIPRALPIPAAPLSKPKTIANMETKETKQLDHKHLPVLDSKSSPKPTDEDDELAQMLTFYQQWLSESQKHHLDPYKPLTTSLYDIMFAESPQPGNLMGLDFFFHSLINANLPPPVNQYETKHEVSANMSSSSALTTATLSGNFPALRRVLSKLPKPDRHNIPLMNFSVVIDTLVKEYNNPYYKNLLCCVENFFKDESWLQKNGTKLGNLFELSIQMAATYYKLPGDDAGTDKLLKALGDYITQDFFWDKFSLSLKQNLKTLLVDNISALRLFTRKELRCPLKELIFLLTKIKTPKDHEAPPSLKNLSDYLLKNEKNFETDLGLVQPICKIFLTHDLELYVPDVATVLPKATLQDRHAFWSFLSNDRALKDDDIVNFYNLFNDSAIEGIFKEQIFTPLMKLAPGVSLEYIHKQLEPTLKLSNINEARTKINELTAAAQAFHDFALNRLLKREDDYYEKSSSYEKFVTLFNSKTPTVNTALFALLNKPEFRKIDLNHIVTITQIWQSSSTIDISYLNRLLHLLVNIEKLPYRLTIIASIPQLQNNTVALNEIEEFKALLTKVEKAVDLLNSLTPQPTEEDHNFVTSLYRLYQQEKLSDTALHQSFRLIKNLPSGLRDDLINHFFEALQEKETSPYEVIRIFSSIPQLLEKMPEDLRKGFWQDLTRNRNAKTSLIEFYNVFLDVTGGKNIDTTLLTTLKDSWTSGNLDKITSLQEAIKTLKNIEDLKDGLKSEDAAKEDFKNAVQDSKSCPGSKVWDLLFAADKNRERFITLQCLHNGMLKADDEKSENRKFIDGAYTQNEQWIFTAVHANAPKLDSKQTADQRQNNLIQCFKSVIGFAKEFQQFTQREDSFRFCAHDDSIKLHSFIYTKIILEYSAQNPSGQRDTKARALFAALNGQLDTHFSETSNTPQNFVLGYSNLFKIIHQYQDDIIEIDAGKFWRQHAKGYSRFYDLTLEITGEVARYFLTNSRISMHERGELFKILRDRHVALVGKLFTKLPNNGHDYTRFVANAAQLTDPQLISPQLDRLRQDFQNTLKGFNTNKDFPSYLRPLLTHLLCLQDLIDTPQMRKESYCPPLRKTANSKVEVKKDIKQEPGTLVSSVKPESKPTPKSETKQEISEVDQEFHQFVIPTQYRQILLKLYRNPQKTQLSFETFISYIKKIASIGYLSDDKINHLYQDYCQNLLSDELLQQAEILMSQLIEARLTYLYDPASDMPEYLAALRTLKPEAIERIPALLTTMKEFGIKARNAQYATALVTVFWHSLQTRNNQTQDIVTLSEKFLDLFTENQVALDSLSVTAFKALTSGWFSGSIQTKEQFSNALIMVQNAEELAAGKIAWDSIFGKLEDKPQKETRMAMMQYLHKGALNLGHEFAENCYQEYSNLASKCISLPQLSQHSDSHRQRQLIKSFRDLASFSQELAQVAQPLSTRPVKPASSSALEVPKSLQQSLLTFFSNKQSEYYWSGLSTNSVRKLQAAELFGELFKKVEAKGSLNHFAYYHTMLMVIEATQKKILDFDKEQDKSWWSRQNTKGYSRLYDITVELYITVARHCLADPSVTLADKKKIHELLAAQAKTQLEMLVERLPEKSSYKNALEKFIKPEEKSQVNYRTFAPVKSEATPQGLTKQLEIYNNDNNFPSHLKYHLTSLLGLQDLAEIPEAVVSDTKHDGKHEVFGAPPQGTV